jgi:hypothetical protein
VIPQYIAPATGVLVVSTAILVTQGIPAYRGLASPRWPRVTGRILTARGETVITGRGMGMLTPDVHYEYTVGNQRFEGNMVSYGSFSRRSTQDLLATLTPGQSVSVSYDPSAPSRAVLHPGVHVAQIIFAAVGLAGFAYGARLLLWALR